MSRILKLLSPSRTPSKRSSFPLFTIAKPPTSAVSSSSAPNRGQHAMGCDPILTLPTKTFQKIFADLYTKELITELSNILYDQRAVFLPCIPKKGPLLRKLQKRKGTGMNPFFIKKKLHPKQPSTSRERFSTFR